MTKLRRRKGYTLIEILVATTVFVVAMSIAAGITVSSTKAVARALTTKKINSAVRDINTQLTQKLRNSSKVTVDGALPNIALINGTEDDTLMVDTNPNSPTYKKITINGKSILPSDIEAEPIGDAFITPNPKLVSISLKISAKKDPTQSMEYITSIACRK